MTISGAALAPWDRDTYSVRSLLLLVAFLVGRSLGLIGSALLLRESLPLLTQKLADLAYN